MRSPGIPARGRDRWVQDGLQFRLRKALMSCSLKGSPWLRLSKAESHVARVGSRSRLCEITSRSLPVGGVIEKINPIPLGWV